MTRLTFGGLILLGLLSAQGCTTPAYENNHWHINHVAPRMSYHFAGYRQSMYGDPRDYFRGEMDDVVLTLERHFLNYNPQNPLFPVPTPKPYRPVPPNVQFEVKNP